VNVFEQEERPEKAQHCMQMCSQHFNPTTSRHNHTTHNSSSFIKCGILSVSEWPANGYLDEVSGRCITTADPYLKH